MSTLVNPVTGDEITLLERPRDDCGDLVFTTRLPAGAAGAPPHRHRSVAERFELLEGEIAFRLGGCARTLRAGDCVDVAPDVVHGFQNVSDAPALLRCTSTPGAGMLRFLLGMQAAAEAGATTAAGLPRDPRRLARLLLDADFLFAGLPAGPQQALFRLFAAADGAR